MSFWRLGLMKRRKTSVGLLALYPLHLSPSWVTLFFIIFFIHDLKAETPSNQGSSLQTQHNSRASQVIGMKDFPPLVFEQQALHAEADFWNSQGQRWRVWPALSFELYYNERSDQESFSQVQGITITQTLPWWSPAQGLREKADKQRELVQHSARHRLYEKALVLTVARAHYQTSQQYADFLKRISFVFKEFEPSVARIQGGGFYKTLWLKKLSLLKRKWQLEQWQTKQELLKWSALGGHTPSENQKVILWADPQSDWSYWESALQHPRPSDNYLRAATQKEIALIEQRYSGLRPPVSLYWNYDQERGGGGEINRILGAQINLPWDQLLGRAQKEAEKALKVSEIQLESEEWQLTYRQKLWQERLQELQRAPTLPSTEQSYQELTAMWGKLKRNQLSLDEAIDFVSLLLDEQAQSYSARTQLKQFLQDLCMDFWCPLEGFDGAMD